MPKRSLALLALCAFALLQVGCGPAAPVPPPSATSSQRYELKGVVISVDPPAKEAVIAHEKITDLMDAMKMSFSVPGASDLEKLQPGKTIKSTLVVENNMMWLEKVEVTGDAPGSALDRPAGGDHAH